MRIIIAATEGKSLINFRGELIKEWVKRGHEVICTSIESSEEMKEKIESIGAKYYQVEGDRTGTNVLKDIRMIFKYIKTFNKFKPDACFLYMSKPIAYGGLAARLCNLKNINLMISGLEIAFYKKGLKHSIVRLVLRSLYNFASKKAENVFFQNPDDMNKFLNYKIVTKEQSYLVNGSGVDMSHFKKHPMPFGDDVILMIGRLVRYKGVFEFVQAAERIRAKYPKVKFRLVGGLDNNSDAMTKEEVDNLVSKNIIEYSGPTDDVRPYLKECSVFVLPSRFEGTPRSVLEAMSTGRPIITTDAPGCKETVKDGYNGFLIQCGDVNALVEQITRLIEDKTLRDRMAENSYEFCSKKYDVRKVNKSILERMNIF